MENKKPIRLQDIADKLGISKVSVSKALRGHRDISSVTTEKVLSAAKEMGYRPNILARKLAAKQTRTIGLIVPKIAHHFLTQAIDGIYAFANEKDYEIVMMVSEEDPALERKHIETLLSMRVDGLLISVSEGTKDRTIFAEVAKHGTPLVFFDRVINDLGFTCISSADEVGTSELITYAIDRGYVDFGHVGGYQEVSIGFRRYQGYQRTLKQFDLYLDPEKTVFGGFSQIDGYQGLSTLHERGVLPQIIFAVTYPVALGVLKRAEELKISIPEELDLICFGNSAYNSFISPSITGINQPADKIGKIALERILLQIQKSDMEFVENISVPVSINIAETCIDIKSR